LADAILSRSFPWWHHARHTKGMTRLKSKKYSFSSKVIGDQFNLGLSALDDFGGPAGRRIGAFDVLLQDVAGYRGGDQ
jgi:hypothetical protein